MSPTVTAGEMYQHPLIYKDNNDIAVPDCMYKMKSIYPDCSKEEMTPEMKVLESKQKQILQDLDELTQEVKLLSNKLGHKFGEKSTAHIAATASSTAATRVTAESDLPAGKMDFVISMDTAHPSIAPLFIADMLNKGGVNIATTSHVHSSLTQSIPEDLFNATKGTNRICTPNAKVLFTFVWKLETFSPSLMFSPLHQTKLLGDSAIVRYLCRLFIPGLYDESDVSVATQIDGWMDISNQISYGGNKEKEAAVKAMNAHLGQHAYLCNDKLTAADIVALSSLIANKTYFKSLPKNVKKWFLQMSNSFDSIIQQIDVPTSWRS